MGGQAEEGAKSELEQGRHLESAEGGCEFFFTTPKAENGQTWNVEITCFSSPEMHPNHISRSFAQERTRRAYSAPYPWLGWGLAAVPSLLSPLGLRLQLSGPRFTETPGQTPQSLTNWRIWAIGKNGNCYWTHGSNENEVGAYGIIYT